jgi:hypothetical protein
VSSGLTTITRFTCGSRIRATSQQLPVTSNMPPDPWAADSPSALVAHRGCSAPAPRSGPSRPRRSRPHRNRGAHPGRSRDPPISSTPLLHLHSMVVDTRRENQRKNDTDRYELERSIQPSRRGGRMKSTGSKPIAENGLPACALPMKARHFRT